MDQDEIAYWLEHGPATLDQISSKKVTQEQINQLHAISIRCQGLITESSLDPQ